MTDPTTPKPLSPPRFVRPARADDADFVATLQASAMIDLLSAVAPEPNWEEAISVDAIRQAWRQTLEDAPVADRGLLIAEENTVAVGFASYAEVDGATEILTLEVEPARRRQGHGSRLLAAIADISRPRHAELRVWIVPQDEARVRFFQSAGFGPGPLRQNLDAGRATLVQHLWSSALG